MVTIQRIVFFLFFLINFISISNSFSSYRPSFSVMTYNLENLFDSLHDEGTNDFTFLPLQRKLHDMEVRRYCASVRIPYYRKQCFDLDWNENVVINKIQNVAKVIRVSDAGRSPDIIVFQEVENINILRKLIKIGLNDEGYDELVLVEGPDKRGIDVAIISKLPLAGDVKYHRIDLSEAFPPGDKIKTTRGILEATFKFKGNFFKVLANHWPSQSNKDITRVIAAKKLVDIVKPSTIPVIVAGDFNTEENDKVNPIKELMTNVDLPFSFIDFESKYFEDYDDGQSHRGTHYYRGKWSSLDKIFIPKNHLTGRSNCRLDKKCIYPVWRSYKVVKFDFMLETESYTNSEDTKFVDIPRRFDPQTGLGVSDHLPAIATFSF
jgi:endonuclease/exonuclease/phosphatase family metal-dependent hydrolase